ncbi:MAG: two pore domain potassium channel family protein [Myxococcales bacterium]|nr:MAG: two pore domain potassium channel family protein [Myxococcales bacterium]
MAIKLAKPRLSQLLTTLLVLALFGPAVSELRYGDGVILAFAILVLAGGVHAIGSNDRRRRLAMVLAVPPGALALLSVFIHARSLIVLEHITMIVFLALVVKVLIDHTMSQREVSADLIRAGLAVYLLVGLLFADVYALFDLLRPGSFDMGHVVMATNVPHRYARVYATRFIYYSLVTLTTLGFGDITPVSTLARSFSAVEAVVGPVFLAVFIGQLVGVRVAQATTPTRGED